MPLIQGEIRVISMKLEDPVVRVSSTMPARSTGLIRGDASRDLDPTRWSLSRTSRSADGTVTYNDAAGGVAREFDHVTARVEAGSLSGPWHCSGSYQDQRYGRPVPGSKRPAGEGRQPSRAPQRDAAECGPDINTDGDVTNGDDGLAYTGTFNIAPVDADDTAGSAVGWRSEGSFALTRGRASSSTRASFHSVRWTSRPARGLDDR